MNHTRAEHRQTTARGPDMVRNRTTSTESDHLDLVLDSHPRSEIRALFF